MSVENIDSEKPFPFVKFRCMKNFCTKENQNGEQLADDYYLRVDGTHNSPNSILINEKRGHIVIGYGNLNGPKYSELKSYCDTRLGRGVNSKLYQSVMDERVQKVKDDKKSKA